MAAGALVLFPIMRCESRTTGGAGAGQDTSRGHRTVTRCRGHARASSRRVPGHRQVSVSRRTEEKGKPKAIKHQLDSARDAVPGRRSSCSRGAGAGVILTATQSCFRFYRCLRPRLPCKAGTIFARLGCHQIHRCTRAPCRNFCHPGCHTTRLAQLLVDGFYCFLLVGHGKHHRLGALMSALSLPKHTVDAGPIIGWNIPTPRWSCLPGSRQPQRPSFVLQTVKSRSRRAPK